MQLYFQNNYCTCGTRVIRQDLEGRVCSHLPHGKNNLPEIKITSRSYALRSAEANNERSCAYPYNSCAKVQDIGSGLEPAAAGFPASLELIFDKLLNT